MILVEGYTDFLSLFQAGGHFQQQPTAGIQKIRAPFNNLLNIVETLFPAVQGQAWFMVPHFGLKVIVFVSAYIGRIGYDEIEGDV